MQIWKEKSALRMGAGFLQSLQRELAGQAVERIGENLLGASPGGLGDGLI